jgi:hypothetical protein
MKLMSSKFNSKLLFLFLALGFAACSQNPQEVQTSPEDSQNLNKLESDGPIQTEDKSQTTEDKNQTTEDKNQTTEDKNQTTEDKNQTTEDKNQATEDKSQTTEDKNQATEDKNQAAEGDNRDSYNDVLLEGWESKFKSTAKALHMKGKNIGEVLAREASSFRDYHKYGHRENNPFYYQFGYAFHNIYKYNSLYTPSFEDLLKRNNGDYEKTFYKSFKSDGSDLGLENNGFWRFINIWEASRNDSIPGDFYPEDMDEELVQALESHCQELEKTCLIHYFYNTKLNSYEQLWMQNNLK